MTSSEAEGQEWAEARPGNHAKSPGHAAPGRVTLSVAGETEICCVRSACPHEAHHTSPPPVAWLEHGAANLFSPPGPYGFAGMPGLARARASKLREL